MNTESMNTDTAVSDTEPGVATEAHDEDHGLTFVAVIKIAVLLALLTGLEVLTYFIDFGSVATPMLLILMVLKFGIVVAYFMHLRFDNWLFTALFVVGLALAVSVYIAALSTFQYFA